MKINKKIKISLVVLLLVFCGIQFWQPVIDKENPNENQVNVFPKEVQTVLEKSCFDCHSNNPKLEWFDKISPASWLVADHIKNAKQGLNFSNWNEMTKAEQNFKLWESINHILAGAMPLKSYSLLHPEAKISETDLKILKEYISSLAPKLEKDSVKTKELEEQFKNWVAQKDAHNQTKLPVDINGIAFIPDYKNWAPISATQRLDNGTMRIILGNEIAQNAIREHKTNPWPDGSIIAKVAWDQLVDDDGNITTGAFKQVEYMIKDNQKYDATEGWGWARFRTPKLEPYGKEKIFTNECIGCHRPMKDNDFVFTNPFITEK